MSAQSKPVARVLVVLWFVVAALVGSLVSGRFLYRSFIGIPEAAIRESLRRHGLPCYTAFPAEICARIAA